MEDASVARAAGLHTRISRRNAGVADEAPPFGAFDRASAKEITKVLPVESQEPLQPGEQQRIILTVWRCLCCILLSRWQTSRLKLHQRGESGAAVPRTNILTDVAAKNVIPDGLSKFLRNAAAQFNRQVRNAFSGVQDIRLDKSLRGTGIKTLPATPAQIRRRQLLFTERRFQIQRR